MTAIKHILELTLNPFFIVLVALLVSSFLLRGMNPIRFVRYVLLIICGVLLICSTGWLPKYMTYKLESTYPIVKKVNPQIKWIVVLGGGHAEIEGEPANDLLTGASLKRLIEGIRLFRQVPHAQLLVSGGGDNKQSFSEAILLQQVSEWLSVPTKKIVLDSNSLNTEEQAKTIAEIVGKNPFYLVTSALHMPRSMRLCHQQGLNPIAAPTDYTLFYHDNLAGTLIPNAYNFYYFNIAMHEVLGMIWSIRLSLYNLASGPAG